MLWAPDRLCHSTSVFTASALQSSASWRPRVATLWVPVTSRSRRGHVLSQHSAECHTRTFSWLPDFYSTCWTPLDHTAHLAPCLQHVLQRFLMLYRVDVTDAAVSHSTDSHAFQHIQVFYLFITLISPHIRHHVHCGVGDVGCGEGVGGQHAWKCIVLGTQRHNGGVLILPWPCTECRGNDGVCASKDNTAAFCAAGEQQCWWCRFTAAVAAAAQGHMCLLCWVTRPDKVGPL